MVSRPEPESEAMDAELVVTPPGCTHLSSFKVDNWKQNLRAIYQCFVWCGTAEARKRKVSPIPPTPETAGQAGSQSRASQPASRPASQRGWSCFWSRLGVRGKGQGGLASLPWTLVAVHPRGGRQGWGGTRVLFSFLAHSPPPPPLVFLPRSLCSLLVSAAWLRAQGGDGAGSRESVQFWCGRVQICEGAYSLQVCVGSLVQRRPVSHVPKQGHSEESSRRGRDRGRGWVYWEKNETKN